MFCALNEGFKMGFFGQKRKEREAIFGENACSFVHGWFALNSDHSPSVDITCDLLYKKNLSFSHSTGTSNFHIELVIKSQS